MGINSMYAVQSCHGTYLSAEVGGDRVCLKNQVEDEEIFDIVAV